MNKHLVALASFFITITSLQAKPVCSFSADTKAVELHWTGYKTKKKLPVSGVIKNVKVKLSNNVDAPFKILESSSFEASPANIFSNNAIRDQRLAKILFAGVKNITGKAGKLSGSKLDYEVSLLSKSVATNIKLQDNGKNITGASLLRLADFPMQSSIKNFAEACKELHQGKTWDEVSVKLVVPYTKKCK